MPAQPKNDKPCWHELGNLFPPMPGEAARILERFDTILARVWPLSPRHRKSLPGDIRKLSQILTSQRRELSKPYWMKPGFISAYLYYFLPWNIIRLARLFSGLKLPEPAWDARPILVDMGAGPFAVAIALWLTRPEWRQKDLRILGVDSSLRSMELGARIFEELCDVEKSQPWKTGLMGSSLKFLPAEMRKEIKRLDGSPWLLACANALNENRRHRISEDDDSLDYLEEILDHWDFFWQEKSFAGMLFMEPGTRLGGTTLMDLRRFALELNLFVAAPCTHGNPCPLLKPGSKRSGLSSSWCHFTFAEPDAPGWLKSLSKEAGLIKNTLSLSTLLLTNHPLKMPLDAVRIISHKFSVPDLSPACRYGCRAAGLALLPDAADLASGSLTLGMADKSRKPDKQSGAIIMKAPKH